MNFTPKGVVFSFLFSPKCHDIYIMNHKNWHAMQQCSMHEVDVGMRVDACDNSKLSVDDSDTGL